MKTPICDFVSKYRASKSLRLHMPGHKGRELLGFESLDITEIDGADVLYSAKGIIKESEENASRLFGTERTLYSTEGSSLAIRAMLYLASLWGRSVGKSATVLAARNAHRVFISGCALLDLDVEWLCGKRDGICALNLSANELDARLSELEKSGVYPFAVYLTSPDYLGNILDISSLSEVCRKHGTLCLVDNAHGAYLGFLSEPRHPVSLGADMSADSAHKTLPTLTGAAYLHISRSAPRLVLDQAENAMALFASTSPSYLILQSLDAANKYIYDGYSSKLKDFCSRLEGLRKRLLDGGYELVGDEPLKLTVRAKTYGYLGTEIGDILAEKGIICEFCDRDFAVMMLTPEISDLDLVCLEDALLSVKRRGEITETAPMPAVAERVMSIRDALMSPSREVAIEDSVGCVLANAAISCPPAVPILVSGERIDERAVECMKYYGISTCFVTQ